MDRLHDPLLNDRVFAAQTGDGWEIWLPDHETEWYDLFRQLDNTPVQLLHRGPCTGRISIVSPCVATNWLFDGQVEHHPRLQGLCYSRLGAKVFNLTGICLPRFEEWETYLSRESRLNPFATEQMKGTFS